MKLKICGLKYSDNIRQIAELRPDYLGFIFYKKSKRFVGENFVMPEIDLTIKRIGVFVNDPEDYILDIVDKYKLDYVQLHGEESPLFCENISKSVNIIKAFGIDEQFDLRVLNEYKKCCKFFLFDTKSENYGGSGLAFDLNVLNGYDNEIPCFIAGGMDLEKFKEITELKLNFYGIDVNSKIEIKPGYKDIIPTIQIRNHVR